MICLWDKLPDEIQAQIIFIKLMKELTEKTAEIPGKRVFFKYKSGTSERLNFYFNENGEYDYFMFDEPSKFQSAYHEKLYIKTFMMTAEEIQERYGDELDLWI